MTYRSAIKTRNAIKTFALAAVLSMTAVAASAFDESKYPNLKGQWRRVPVPGVTGQPAYDQTKIQGRSQQAPLTPESQAILEASLADQAAGGQGNDPTYICISPGMPRIRLAAGPCRG